MSKIKRRTRNSVEDKMIKNIDHLAQFEEFKNEILPALQADIKKRTPAKEVLQKVMTLAAARLATLAVSETDPTKALAIIKEIFDRVEGKSKESVETTHKFKNLKPTEIDALLLSEMASLTSNKEDEKPN